MITTLRACDLKPGDVVLTRAVSLSGGAVAAVVVGTVVDDPEDAGSVLVYEASVVPTIQRFRRTLPLRVLRGD